VKARRLLLFGESCIHLVSSVLREITKRTPVCPTFTGDILYRKARHRPTPFRLKGNGGRQDRK
jgi:hypothetical protein